MNCEIFQLITCPHIGITIFDEEGTIPENIRNENTFKDFAEMMESLKERSCMGSVAEGNHYKTVADVIETINLSPCVVKKIEPIRLSEAERLHVDAAEMHLRRVDDEKVDPAIPGNAAVAEATPKVHTEVDTEAES